jgi:hypothetical protein
VFRSIFDPKGNTTRPFSTGFHADDDDRHWQKNPRISVRTCLFAAAAAAEQRPGSAGQLFLNNMQQQLSRIYLGSGTTARQLASSQGLRYTKARTTRINVSEIYGVQNRHSAEQQAKGSDCFYRLKVADPGV